MDKEKKNVVEAYPSKLFFVSMLTRDIELADAILDLLDNCVDGVLRSIANQKRNKERPYEGFSANVTLSPTEFVISDNCGGIPRDIAESYAFRLGRPNLDIDKGLPTVGMYGIGMKRAMFKMGRQSEVASAHKDACFVVKVPEKWLTDDKSWVLPIEDVPRVKNTEYGTRITVTKLHDSIKRLFSEQDSDFISELHEMIGTYYAYILHRGFQVTVNKRKVVARTISVLSAGLSEKGIRPYIYKTRWKQVEVSLIVGLMSDIPSEEDAEEEAAGKAFSGKRANAGWTVLCNERVVLFGDKTMLTGWGEAGVPAFHSQFRGIAGLVQFRSDEPLLLPVTTTKRGINAESELYLQVKEFMREGLKKFTNFTNDWKTDTPERREIFQGIKTVDALAALQAAKPERTWATVRKSIGGQRYSPDLPKPAKHQATRKIVFSRPTTEIEEVGEFLFASADTDPSTIGERCFELQLKRAQKA